MEELDDWAFQLRNEVPISRAIDILAERVRGAGDEDRYLLGGWLETYLVQAGRDQEAVQFLDQMIDKFREDVRYPIRKANLYLYFIEDPAIALKCIDFALQRANRTGFFLREALGVKARILLKLCRGEQLSHVLEEIMSMQMVKGIPDIGRERDFVDRAPPGLISPDVLVRYNQFRPKRRGDGTADEPPEWEPPEWE